MEPHGATLTEQHALAPTPAAAAIVDTSCDSGASSGNAARPAPEPEVRNASNLKKIPHTHSTGSCALHTQTVPVHVIRPSSAANAPISRPAAR